MGEYTDSYNSSGDDSANLYGSGADESYSSKDSLDPWKNDLGEYGDDVAAEDPLDSTDNEDRSQRRRKERSKRRKPMRKIKKSRSNRHVSSSEAGTSSSDSGTASTTEIDSDAPIVQRRLKSRACKLVPKAYTDVESVRKVNEAEALERTMAAQRCNPGMAPERMDPRNWISNRKKTPAWERTYRDEELAVRKEYEDKIERSLGMAKRGTLHKKRLAEKKKQLEMDRHRAEEEEKLNEKLEAIKKREMEKLEWKIRNPKKAVALSRKLQNVKRGPKPISKPVPKPVFKPKSTKKVVKPKRIAKKKVTKKVVKPKKAGKPKKSIAKKTTPKSKGSKGSKPKIQAKKLRRNPKRQKTGK